MSLSTSRVPTRSNSRASSTASSSLSAALVADCDSATRPAAAAVLPASATAVKMASWRRVIRMRGDSTCFTGRFNEINSFYG